MAGRELAAGRAAQTLPDTWGTFPWWNRGHGRPPRSSALLPRLSKLRPRAATHTPSSGKPVPGCPARWGPGVTPWGTPWGHMWLCELGQTVPTPQQLPRTGHTAAPLTRDLRARQTSRGRGTADGDPARSRPATLAPPGEDPAPGDEGVGVRITGVGPAPLRGQGDWRSSCGAGPGSAPNTSPGWLGRCSP